MCECVCYVHIIHEAVNEPSNIFKMRVKRAGAMEKIMNKMGKKIYINLL